MKIAVGNSRMDKKWKNRDISWDDLCRKVSVTQRTTETVEEYRKLKKGIFNDLPIKHKNIICQPMISPINLKKYLNGIELVVVGGESDKNARLLNYDWVLDVRSQCVSANVSFEFRQCGTHFVKDGKEYANAPDIEVYLNPDPQNAEYEVWIPITKKNN